MGRQDLIYSLEPGTWLQPHGIGVRSGLSPLNRLGSLWLARVCGEGSYGQQRRYRLVPGGLGHWKQQMFLPAHLHRMDIAL